MGEFIEVLDDIIRQAKASQVLANIPKKSNEVTTIKPIDEARISKSYAIIKSVLRKKPRVPADEVKSVLDESCKKYKEDRCLRSESVNLNYRKGAQARVEVQDDVYRTIADRAQRKPIDIVDYAKKFESFCNKLNDKSKKIKSTGYDSKDGYLFEDELHFKDNVMTKG
eukprot:Seg1688.6 transcript_id=Seg1688.6/GoldUCD/mRNA.D3Y31 product="hypothetical protein" protein_id=Seg1688.6/GoldUCD/D3Y31